MEVFPSKLMQILNDAADEGFESIISWLPPISYKPEKKKKQGGGIGDDDDSSWSSNSSSSSSSVKSIVINPFRIHKPKDFETSVMPRYFPSFNNKPKYRSFHRNLNLWCFERIEDKKGGPLKNAYYHPQFKRDEPSLCKDMVRIRIKKKSNSNSNEALHGGNSNLELQPTLSLLYAGETFETATEGTRRPTSLFEQKQLATTSVGGSTMLRSYSDTMISRKDHNSATMMKMPFVSTAAAAAAAASDSELVGVVASSKRTTTGNTTSQRYLGDIRFDHHDHDHDHDDDPFTPRPIATAFLPRVNANIMATTTEAAPSSVVQSSSTVATAGPGFVQPRGISHAERAIPTTTTSSSRSHRSSNPFYFASSSSLASASSGNNNTTIPTMESILASQPSSLASASAGNNNNTTIPTMESILATTRRAISAPVASINATTGYNALGTLPLLAPRSNNMTTTTRTSIDDTTTSIQQRSSNKITTTTTRNNTNNNDEIFFGSNLPHIWDGNNNNGDGDVDDGEIHEDIF